MVILAVACNTLGYPGGTVHKVYKSGTLWYTGISLQFVIHQKIPKTKKKAQNPKIPSLFLELLAGLEPATC